MPPSSAAVTVIAGVPVVLAVFDEVIGAGNYGDRPGRRRHPCRSWRCGARGARHPGAAHRRHAPLNLICHLSGIATTTAEGDRARRHLGEGP